VQEEQELNAVLVSVDYADLLAITLPYNRKHFDRVLVVTDTTHSDWTVAEENRCDVYRTDAFYLHGAVFNKWLALEEGLTQKNFRRNWLCFMDADVLWPSSVSFFESYRTINWHVPGGGLRHQICSQLATPQRRVWTEWPAGFSGKIPDESHWQNFPLHREDEFAGYSQIFHAADSHLPQPPWHQVNWMHAGGADSFFQDMWGSDRKMRPPFEVLHLGPCGRNWYGRCSHYADGSIHPEAEGRRQMVGAIGEERKRTGYSRERIGVELETLLRSVGAEMRDNMLMIPCQGKKADGSQHCIGRIRVPFSPAIGGASLAQPPGKDGYWIRVSGENIDNLTLSPSIDAGDCGHFKVVGGKVI
jgi:hypothetical protein